MYAGQQSNIIVQILIKCAPRTHMFKYIFASLVLYSSYWRERECWLLFSIPFEFNIVRVLLLNSILPVVVRIFLRTESCANELDNGVRAIDVYTCCRRQHIYIYIYSHTSTQNTVMLCHPHFVSPTNPPNFLFFFHRHRRPLSSPSGDVLTFFVRARFSDVIWHIRPCFHFDPFQNGLQQLVLLVTATECHTWRK